MQYVLLSFPKSVNFTFLKNTLREFWFFEKDSLLRVISSCIITTNYYVLYG